MCINFIIFLKDNNMYKFILEWFDYFCLLIMYPKNTSGSYWISMNTPLNLKV